jgi:hypothetical protein
MRAGRYGIVADPFVTRRPCAFAMIASDLSHSGRPPALIGFGRLSLCVPELSPSDTHPLLRVRLTAASLRSSRTLRRHALATALLRPNQSPQAKNYQRDPFNTTGPTCRGSVTCGASAPIVHASASSVGRLS